MGQLGQQNGGLQRIETRIGPDLFMMVLLRATMETQFLEAVCGGVSAWMAKGSALSTA